MQPSIASVSLPIILTVASVLMGDSGAVLPLIVLLLFAVLLKVATRMKAMQAWKAGVAAILVWFSIILVEQKMHPEIASYRAAGGSVSAGLSLIPYVGPLLVFVSNAEKVRIEKLPDRIKFQSNGPMVEKFSMEGMGMMFAFCFGLLRLPIRFSKEKVPHVIES